MRSVTLDNHVESVSSVGEPAAGTNSGGRRITRFLQALPVAESEIGSARIAARL